MSTHPPRPILKRDMTFHKQASNPLPFTACGTIISPHVHFPPTPGLTETHPAHSPHTYDRHPIMVSPNACLLPERNGRQIHTPTVEFEIERPQRGRSQERKPKQTSVKGSYFHPRAFEACEPEPLDGSISLSPPPLVRDASSPSDEEVIITPPSHSSPWSTRDEGSPILTDVYVVASSLHNKYASDDAQPSRYGKDRRRRPNLQRVDHDRLAKRPKASFAGPDEGCLGGF